MNNKDRFARIQVSRMNKTSAIADNELIEKHLAGKPDTVFVDSALTPAAYPEFKPEVSFSGIEVEKYLLDLRNQFRADRTELIMSEIRGDVTRSIITSLGLGSFLAAYDKTGGNVNTIYNVREGIWATEDEKKNYENRGKFDKDEKASIHRDAKYIEAGQETKQRQLTEGSVEDIYTGLPEQRGKMDVDHIKSKKETHHDPARVLAELDTKDLANIAENLGPTHQTINRSKGANNMEDYIDKNPDKINNLLDKITNLEKKLDLSQGESDELRNMKAKLETFRNFDPEKARTADEEARKAQDKKINNEYYKSTKFLRNSVSASALEAGKMGIQQALGLILVEFAAACFDETKQLITSNISWDKIIPVLRASLSRTAKRLASRWKIVLSAFIGGSVSGFLSSLITTLINVFYTTAKRVVRLIREGIFSLLRALKVAIFPQEDQGYADSFHAASKLLFSGAVFIGGIALEEVVEKAVLSVYPGLGALATPLVLAIVAGFTTLAVAFGCYILDRLDLFGAVESEQDRFVDERISVSIARQEERLNSLLGDLRETLS